MAYRADIEIGVKGARSLEQLRSSINLTATAVDSLNDVVSARGSLVQSVQNYTKNLDRAARSLQRVGAGTEAETKAVREYVQALGEANTARARQNSLVAQEIANQRRVTPGNAGVGQQGPALPPALIRAQQVQQGWNRFFQEAAEVAQELQSSAAARSTNLKTNWNRFFQEAAEVAQELQSSAAAKAINIRNSWGNFFQEAQELALELAAQTQRATAEIRRIEGSASAAARQRLTEESARRSRIQDAGFGVQGPQPASAAPSSRSGGPGRFSNVVLGAGFPLLFGGGPGAVLGGAAGGLVGGPGAFAAQIGLSALGQQLDMFAASAAKTGAALSPLTADVDAVTQALGITGTTTATYIAELKELERQDEALAVATEEMARLVGDRGVQALRSFGEAATELSNEWARAMTQMQAALAGLLAGPLRAVVDQLENANLFRQAQASSDPRIQQLIELRNRPGILGGTGNRSINDITGEIVELQRKANIEAQKREQIENTTVGTLTQQKRVLEAQLELAYTDGDLTSDKVFKLAQIVIDKEFEVKLQQAINDKTDVELVQLDRKLKLQQLSARREQAIAAAAAKAAGELERQRKEMERMAELRRRQLDDAQRSFVLAEADIDIATSNTKESKLQAEFDKVRIERMFTFSELLRKALSDEEREALVQTQYLQGLRDSIKQEEQLLEIKKQQTKEMYAQLGVPGILDEQVQKRLGRGMSPEDGADKRVGVLGFTSGINLDPNNKATQKMDEMKRRLEELSDPINVAAQGAQGIGNAFSTAFQGIITGTQSTQEALSNFFKGVGDAFVSMATEIIAQMVVMFAFKQLLGLFGGGGGSLFSGAGPVGMPGAGVGGGASMFGAGAPSFFAEGGFVTGPTNALIGEGGEPEYVIPFSKMDNAMANWAEGKRGDSVLGSSSSNVSNAFSTINNTAIPFTKSTDRLMTERSERETVAAINNPKPLDVRFESQVINGVEYVTAEQHQKGMTQAAERGRALALSALQNSVKTRKRVGVG